MTQEGRPVTTPFSVRFTADERMRLEARAGRRPLGEFIREAALDRAGLERRKRSDRPSPKHADRALAEVLVRLGRSDLSANLASMARSAETGLLLVRPEHELLIVEACTDIRQVRDEVLGYLRLLRGSA